MFNGFNDATIAYLEALERENSKVTYQENESLYIEGIKEPLEQMYIEMYDYLAQIDSELLGNKRRCISTAYNDARFSKNNPMKVYFYLKFKLDRRDKMNAPGFFFDASLEGYRYGLNIYNMDTKGMEKIRDYILDNKNFATTTIKKFEKAGKLDVYGDKMKREHYPDEAPLLKNWLDRKNLDICHVDVIRPVFFERQVYDDMITAFDSVKEVYSLIKEALIN